MLLTSAGAPAPLAQSSSSPSVAPAPAQYGVAYVYVLMSGACKLALLDGVSPTPRYKYYQENGSDKEFADEAAVFSFLAAQRWEVSPYGNEERNRYFLRHRA